MEASEKEKKPIRYDIAWRRIGQRKGEKKGFKRERLVEHVDRRRPYEPKDQESLA